MATTAVAPTTSTVATSASKTANSAASLADNYNNFLTLLTTQLKHQDPLSPMDTTQFTQQLVTFTQVEQALESNKKLDMLVSLGMANQSVGAIQFIGKTIEATSDTGVLADGAAKYTYTLPGGTKKTSVVITDAAGKLVYSEPGKTTAGKHEFNWNGKKLDGSTAPDGSYKIKIVATDAEEKEVVATTTVIGKVTGIESSDEGALMVLGASKIPVGAVIGVRDQATDEDS